MKDTETFDLAAGQVSDALRETLRQYRFDEPRLRDHARALAREGVRPQAAHLTVAPRPPPTGSVVSPPAVGSEARAAAEQRGRKAIAEGRLAAVILAGGMATRFGGVVKATAECLPGRTFLDLKLTDVARAGDVLPVVLVSYATERAVRAELARLGREALVFAQSVSLRLTPEGQLFLEDGAPSPYAPGHGDVLDALHDTGALDLLRGRGVRTLVVSNVDNLGASPDAALFGEHVVADAAVTVEVVARGRLDRGGAPALLGDRVEVVEAFRFPTETDVEAFDTFNTNTLWIEATSLDRRFPLDDFAVVKTVGGRKAVQFERLIGQITHFLTSRYVRVAREGPDGRFLPVKDVEELTARREEIETRLRAAGVL